MTESAISKNELPYTINMRHLISCKYICYSCNYTVDAKQVKSLYGTFLGNSADNKERRLGITMRLSTFRWLPPYFLCSSLVVLLGCTGEKQHKSAETYLIVLNGVM